MYPSMLRLHDGRVLLTFTQRCNGLGRMTSSGFGVNGSNACHGGNLTDGYGTGLRGLLSYDDGASWDFESDYMVLKAQDDNCNPAINGRRSVPGEPSGTDTCLSWHGLVMLHLAIHEVHFVSLQAGRMGACVGMEIQCSLQMEHCCRCTAGPTHRRQAGVNRGVLARTPSISTVPVQVRSIDTCLTLVCLVLVDGRYLGLIKWQLPPVKKQATHPVKSDDATGIVTQASSSRTFYVDSRTGNDTAAGCTPST
jgi:hypothetical protein